MITDGEHDKVHDIAGSTLQITRLDEREATPTQDRRHYRKQDVRQMLVLVGAAETPKFAVGQADVRSQRETGVTWYNHPSEYVAVLCRTGLWPRAHKGGEMANNLWFVEVKSCKRK